VARDRVVSEGDHPGSERRGVAAVLDSPRLRRRLLGGGVVVGVMAALVATALIWPNTAERQPEQPLSGGGVTRTAPPASVQLSRQTRGAALATAQRFLTTAVKRRRVGASWQLVHPSLRQGLTRREWSSGNIPVIPYPVDSARWRLGYSQRDAVGLEVYLQPTAGSSVRPMVFDLELRALRVEGRRRWLVSSWSPRGGSMAAQAQASPERETALREATREREGYSLGAGWLFAPFVAILSVLLVPAYLLVRDRRRGIKAERESSRHRAARHPPPD